MTHKEVLKSIRYHCVLYEIALSILGVAGLQNDNS